MTPDPVTVFDRTLVRRHRDRAASLLDRHEFLFRDAAERLVDRLADMKRRFPRALDLGCHTGTLARTEAALDRIDWLVQSDLSPEMATRAPVDHQRCSLVMDEEALSFAQGTFDLVLSVLSLHWVNDLPGTLIQLRRTLTPDGLLLVCLLGGDTLRELRELLAEAELAEEGGASPRVSPFVDIREAGAVLQRAGFAMPVVDATTIIVTYEDPLALLRDLGAMGESNALLNRRRAPLRRATLARTVALYRDRHADSGGRVTATFQILTLTGWAPHPTQPRPLRAGEASRHLGEVLGQASGLQARCLPNHS